jgi:heme/copper-type cytochrome/quinol oxidase subunit 2
MPWEARVGIIGFPDNPILLAKETATYGARRQTMKTEELIVAIILWLIVGNVIFWLIAAMLVPILWFINRKTRGRESKRRRG